MSMNCTNCGRPLSNEDAFCPVCGTPAPKESPPVFCQNCGQRLPEGAAFCNKCGTPAGSGGIGQNSFAPPPPQQINFDREPQQNTYQQPDQRFTGNTANFVRQQPVQPQQGMMGSTPPTYGQTNYSAGGVPGRGGTARKKGVGGIYIVIAIILALLVALVFGVKGLVTKLGKDLGLGIGSSSVSGFNDLCDMTSLGTQSYIYARVLTERLLETDLATADPNEVKALITKCMDAWQAAEEVAGKMQSLSDKAAADKGIDSVKPSGRSMKFTFGQDVFAEGEAPDVAATLDARTSAIRCGQLAAQYREDCVQGQTIVSELQSVYSGRTTSVTQWETAVRSASGIFSTQMYINGEITSGSFTAITTGTHSLRTLSNSVKAGSIAVSDTDILVDVGSRGSCIVYNPGEGITVNREEFGDYDPEEGSTSISINTYPRNNETGSITFHRTSFFSWFVLDRVGGFRITRGNKDGASPIDPPSVSNTNVDPENNTEQGIRDTLNNGGIDTTGGNTRGPIDIFTPPITPDDIRQTSENIENGRNRNGNNDTSSSNSSNQDVPDPSSIAQSYNGGVGPITSTMAWATEDDLDLHMDTPDGSHIYYRNKSAQGGTLDIDMNASDIQIPACENIYFPDPENGHYKVYIRDYRDRTTSSSTHYKVTVKIGDEVHEFEGDIDGSGTEVLIYEFDYNGHGNSSIPQTSLDDGRFVSRGAHTGTITVQLAWDRFDDVDLHMETPDGSHIYYSNKTAGGGVLDVDSNASSPYVTDPAENIYFASPQNGHYKVYIKQFSDRSDDSAHYMVRVSVDGEVREFEGYIDGTGTEIPIYEFDYNGASGDNGSTSTFNNHRYAYYEDEGISWTQARAACQAMGGHLATITSPAEQDHLNNTYGKDGWIGAYGDESGYVWVTGETWGYTNWRSNQPDNANGDEWFVHMWGGQWNDLNNDDSTYNYAKGYYCEWDSLSDLNEQTLIEQMDEQGAQSGKITVSLMWDTYDDLDLHVFTPNGNEIYYSNSSADGGYLDVDANAGSERKTNPIENIFFEEPMSGDYWVYLYNYTDRTEGAATNYIVRVQVGSDVQTYTGTISNEGETIEVVGFTYNAGNGRSNGIPSGSTDNNGSGNDGKEFATAIPISIGQTIDNKDKMTAGQEHVVYKFTTGAAGSYTVTLSHPQDYFGTADAIFVLSDSSQNRVADEVWFQGETSKIFTLNANSTYYLETWDYVIFSVTAGSGSSTLVGEGTWTDNRGPNLLVNPGAEDGLNGWTGDENWRNRDESGDNALPRSGSGFFTAGISEDSSIHQDVDISAYRGRNVTLGAWMAGWETQADESHLYLQFLDASGNEIATYETTRGSDTSWKYFTITKQVPSNAKTARVILRSVRSAGSYNDGYFDDLSLTVS
ncbi:MAG: zinc-ribbon domain-containing protein [Oscillospiraceae bacterium]|nr:zinc-ribbon domain-containing protein [Oscillospiraceae bacterium]